MRRQLLDYELPPDLIATHPLDERDGARLMVVAANSTASPSGLTHHVVRDLHRIVPSGSVLVVNDTRVIPARFLGRKVGTGGRTEILLIKKLGTATVDDGGRYLPAERWTALGKASKPLRLGARIAFDCNDGSDGGQSSVLCAEIAGRSKDDGHLDVLIFSPTNTPIDVAIEMTGHVPLPPYLRRADDSNDRARYQTVFARVPGAVAAPTAGLHLSPALMSRLEERGVVIARVTLHVGLGTFQPVTVDDLDQHPMHSEAFVVPEEAATAIAQARDRRAPVIAVGTTVVRALESAADPLRPGLVRPSSGDTRLLIQPGYCFRVVDQLLTNFHLPQSTLLALVAAFGGYERVLAAYRTAIAERYRFFSYGDAMLLCGRFT